MVLISVIILFIVIFVVKVYIRVDSGPVEFNTVQLYEGEQYIDLSV